MTKTEELEQAVTEARSKVNAHLRAIAEADALIATEATAYTLTPEEIEAVGPKIAAAKSNRPLLAVGLDGARTRLAEAVKAHAESRAPELEREIAHLYAGLVTIGVQFVGTTLPAAHALVERVTEHEALGTAKKFEPEFLTAKGALTAAFNKALTGAGDGLVDCTVVRGLLLSSDAPWPLVAGRQYREGDTLRLPEAIAAKYVREGHLARLDAARA